LFIQQSAFRRNGANQALSTPGHFFFINRSRRTTPSVSKTDDEVRRDHANEDQHD
jgi:hypothetical protein